MAPQRTAGACRSVKFFYIRLRVPPRCTASLWVTSLGTRIQCGGTLSLLPSGTDSLVVCSDTVYAALYAALYGAAASSATTSLPSRPRCSTNDYVVCNAPACNPQRRGTPAGAGRAYSSRWRRGPGLSYRLGRAGHTLASPSATVRWQTVAPGQQTQIKKKPRSDRRTAGVLPIKFQRSYTIH